jgi:hypothetical protein
MNLILTAEATRVWGDISGEYPRADREYMLILFGNLAAQAKSTKRGSSNRICQQKIIFASCHRACD